MNLEQRLRYLKAFLLVSGLAFVVGLPLLMKIFPAGFYWEPRQSEYEQMILGVYITLGIFLLLAARDPLRHLSLIWFTAWSSLVHGGIMAVQAAVDPLERENFFGDIPALLIVFIGFAILTPRSRDLPDQKVA